MSSEYTPPNLVKPTPGGNPGDGSISGKLTVGPSTNGPIVIDGNGQTIYNTNNLGSLTIGVTNGSGDVILQRGGIYVKLYNNVEIYPSVGRYNKVLTAGMGVAPIYGKDVRTGLTAVDASATTLYTTTAAGQVYEVAARILGTGGTITSGVYTIGWTEGGTARTATVSISAAGTLDSAMFLLQPDSGTAITGELTTLSGTSPVVNVAAILKEDV